MVYLLSVRLLSRGSGFLLVVDDLCILISFSRKAVRALQLSILQMYEL